MSADSPDLPQRMARIKTVMFDGGDLITVVLGGESIAIPRGPSTWRSGLTSRIRRACSNV